MKKVLFCLLITSFFIIFSNSGVYSQDQLSKNDITQYVEFPNDPDFKDQKYLHNEVKGSHDLGYLEYYRYYKAHRDEIVSKYLEYHDSLPIVAIVDADYNLRGIELKGNDYIRYWINEDEIPRNGIDDDGNGWVDDYDIMNFVDKVTYKEKGRNEIVTAIGGLLYSTPYPPADEFDRQSDFRGQNVAKIAGAKQDNEEGMHGILPDEIKMILITQGHKNSGTWINTRDSLYYISDLKDDGVNIVAINMSFANAFKSDTYFGFDFTFSKNALEDRLKGLEERGILYAAAAGNEYRSADLQPIYPASSGFNNGIVVGAATSRGQKEQDSNYGFNTLDIFAVQDSTLGATAIATAVIGVANLLYPACAPLEIKELILESYMPVKPLIQMSQYDGIIRLSGEDGVGLITKNEGESDYHLNTKLRDKICAAYPEEIEDTTDEDNSTAEMSGIDGIID